MPRKDNRLRVLKKAVQKTLSALGYELTRSSRPRASFDNQVLFDNFVQLSQAYEQRLNESINLISANEVRPKLLARLLGTPPSQAYFIVQALVQCRDLGGDVCEFGVAQGATSALVANEIAPYNNKLLHLFDSFEGLPKPSEKDKLKVDMFSLGSIEAYTGTMASPEDMVRSRLESISFPSQRYVIHKGFIEESILADRNLPKEVCFAYVDLDFYKPIKFTLDFLHQISPIGAIVIVDDYDFFSTGSKTAVDEFLEERNSSEMRYECCVPNTRYGYCAVLTKSAPKGNP